ncbi:MAG: hypothetical protein K9W43_13945 [Candidatus Thorarchaeota archaeon]|nr:hypothetical protein [Candidatus Thorarchaeota archaeon]
MEKTANTSVFQLLKTFTTNKEAMLGVGMSVLLICICTSWFALIYAGLTRYLLIITFPLFNGMFIISIILFVIRGVNKTLITLQTTDGGLRKALVLSSMIAFAIVLSLNVLFEIISSSRLLRNWFIGYYSQINSFTLIDYVPDSLTLFTIIVDNLLLYYLFATFSIWIISKSKRIRISTEPTKNLAILEGFISKDYFFVLVLLGIAIILNASVINSTITFMGSPFQDALPIIWLTGSVVFNSLLSYLLWFSAWKNIDRNPPVIE